MDSNDERIACAAAYYILLCGEFLKSRGAASSQQKQAHVTAPAAPHQRDVQARQRLNWAPMAPNVDVGEKIYSAPLLSNVEEAFQVQSCLKSLKRCVENVYSAPILDVYSAPILDVYSAPRLNVYSPPLVVGLISKVSSAPRLGVVGAIPKESSAPRPSVVGAIPKESSAPRPSVVGAIPKERSAPRLNFVGAIRKTSCAPYLRCIKTIPKVSSAPRLRVVGDIPKKRSAPYIRFVKAIRKAGSAPRLNGVKAISKVRSSPRLSGVEAITKESSAPHVVTESKTDSTTVSSPTNVEEVNSAPIKPEAPKRARHSSAAVVAATSKIKAARTRRRVWTVYKRRRRSSVGDFLNDLRKEPSDKLEYFCRMSASDFENVLSEIAPLIAKQDTNMRISVPVQERLAVALRFLATGETYTSLSDVFNFSRQTVSLSVDAVCKALIETHHKEIELPMTTDHWRNIAEQYEKQWSFPNCLGAIGGKKIIFESPSSKADHTVVIFLALVDANCSFTFVDIGCQGLESCGDAQIDLSFITKFPTDQVNLPLDRPLPSSHIPVPYVFLGDDVFTLSQRTMTPYPGVFERRSAQRIFNYRLSRARRVIDNVFGLMASVFGVLQKQTLRLEPDKVMNIMKACVLLHNILMKSTSSSYAPLGTFDAEVNGEILPGSWRNHCTETWSLSLDKGATSNPEEIAKGIRNSFAEYFITSGRLPWQDERS